MRREAFNAAYVRLMNAFPNQAEKITEATQEVYWEALQEIPDDLWENGFRTCLRTCNFFPTIKELGVACCGEQKPELVQCHDPWREKQNWLERMPEITWQQNLERILTQRDALQGPENLKTIEPPERPDYVQRRTPVEVRKLLHGLAKDLDTRAEGKKEEQEKERQKRLEQRRKLLEEQAKMLLGRG